jgi:DNA invertase Pin-like site-specific DNA recombinase
MSGLLAIFAEFERRDFAGTNAGWPGPPPGRTAKGWAGLQPQPQHTAEIRKLHRAGVNKSEIARRVQIGRTSVRRILGVKS